HQNLVLCLAFSPDGQLLASGGQDNTVKIWETPAIQPIQELGGPKTVETFALTSDGGRIVIAGKDAVVRVLNSRDGKQLAALAGHRGPINELEIAANGQ